MKIQLEDAEISDMQAFWGKREWIGSCNACQRRDDERVAEIQLRTIAVRVCADCAESLRDILDALLSE